LGASLYILKNWLLCSKLDFFKGILDKNYERDFELKLIKGIKVKILRGGK
jgi:hypothetical protein